MRKFIFSRDEGQKSHNYTKDQTRHSVIVKMCDVKTATVAVQRARITVKRIAGVALGRRGLAE